ncbi:MAG: polyketide cyclase [Flaviramulus sp.]|nr:SRPBCC family protein [Flaviramulus sp.]NNC50288.1 polyketide cyclase [Flaviramulus sp.]
MDNKSKCSEAQMLIRKSVNEVYNAFIDPMLTKNFWFTKGSGKLEIKKEIVWTWDMYNFSAKVIATQIIPDKKIEFDWFTNDKPTFVTIDFIELNLNATFVSIIHHGFDKTGDELIEILKDSTGGFTLVLAGLKAYLEHGINLNLVADKYPIELTNHEEELKNRSSS